MKKENLVKMMAAIIPPMKDAAPSKPQTMTGQNFFSISICSENNALNMVIFFLWFPTFVIDELANDILINILLYMSIGIGLMKLVQSVVVQRDRVYEGMD